LTAKNEFENFDHLTRKLLKVPHNEIKAELDAERAKKKRKKKKPGANK
jgi:hypothetical protein